MNDWPPCPGPTFSSCSTISNAFSKHPIRHNSSMYTLNKPMSMGCIGERVRSCESNVSQGVVEKEEVVRRPIRGNCGDDGKRKKRRGKIGGGRRRKRRKRGRKRRRKWGTRRRET